MKKIFFKILLLSIFIISIGNIYANESSLSDDYKSRIDLAFNNMINKIDDMDLSIYEQKKYYKQLIISVDYILDYKKSQYTVKDLLVIEYIKLLLNDKLELVTENIKCSWIDSFESNMWYNNLKNEYLYDKYELAGWYNVGCYYKEYNIFIFANKSGLFTYDITSNNLNNYNDIILEKGTTYFIPYTKYIQIKSTISNLGTSYTTNKAIIYLDNLEIELYEKCNYFYSTKEEKWNQKCNYEKEYFGDIEY